MMKAPQSQTPKGGPAMESLSQKEIDRLIAINNILADIDEMEAEELSLVIDRVANRIQSTLGHAAEFYKSGQYLEDEASALIAHKYVEASASEWIRILKDYIDL
jgi:hypothetical protein